MKDNDWSRAALPGGPRGPADDGKRLGLSESALDVALPAAAYIYIEWEGVWGRVVTRSGSIEGWRIHALG